MDKISLWWLVFVRVFAMVEAGGLLLLASVEVGEEV
jgi:hypothetical protein